MAQIDRTEKEKTFQIGRWKVKTGNLCLIALVIILIGSSLGYIAGRDNSQPENENEQSNLIQVQAVIIFDINNTSSAISKVVSVEQGKNAADVFSKVATLKTEDTDTGKKVVSVSAENSSAENSDSEEWVFYVNGRLYLKGVDTYTINEGDQVLLQYQEKAF